MVLITQFTTVYPTDFVQATIAPSASSTSTPTISSSPGLGSNVPHPTISISSIITSSQTLLPASSATGIPLAPKQKFDDTFAYVTLAALIVFAVLLIGMVSYMVYLRCKGECLRCRGMQQQLAKWESGELTRITPLMVMKRDALNKTASSSDASLDVDVEMGFAARKMSRAPTMDEREANKKPTLFQKVKARITRKGKSPAQILNPPSDNGLDRFFTVKADAPVDNPDPSRHTTSQLPQTGYDSNCLYATRYSEYPNSSMCTQPIDIGRTAANGSRVFSEISTSNMTSIRGPLRQESDEPNRYTAYAPTNQDPYDSRQKEHNVATALARLESREYKEAEAILKRASATESETRRALSMVNLGDQQLNIARHPSAYTEVGLPLDPHPEAEVPARPESYQVLDWRKKDLRPPEREDVQEDFSEYLNQELANKRK